MGLLYPRIATSTGTTYYVATTGSDGNPGTDALPWATLLYAINNAPAGAIILVKPGSYVAPNGVTTGGTVLAPKTVRARDGLGTVTTTGRWRFNGTGASFIRVESIEHNGTTSPDVGVWFDDDTTDHEWYNCNVHDAQQSNFISATLARRIHIINCKSHLAGRRQEATHNLDHGMYLAGTEHMVLNCEIFDNDANGIQLYQEGDRAIVSHNTIDGNGRSGVIIGGTTIRDTDDSVVTNNILSNNGFWTQALGGAGGYGVRTSFSPSNIGSGNIVKNNLIFNNYSGDTYFPDGGVIYTPYGVSGAASNPKFTSLATNDFRLLPASPALGGGDPDYSLTYDHAARPRQPAYDIGAHESQQVVGIARSRVSGVLSPRARFTKISGSLKRVS